MFFVLSRLTNNIGTFQSHGRHEKSPEGGWRREVAARKMTEFRDKFHRGGGRNYGHRSPAGTRVTERRCRLEREREREAGMFLVPGTENGWLEGGWNGLKRGRKKGIGATGVGLHSAR